MAQGLRLTDTLVEPMLEKVTKDSTAFAGQNRFGMKLDAVNRPGAVPQPHDGAIFTRARGHLQVAGETVVSDHQRVVPRREKGRGQTAEDATAVMLDGRRLAVHRHRRTNDRAATDGTKRLMTKADTEDRRCRAELADHVHRDAGVLG